MREGFVFFAIPGTQLDGIDHATFAGPHPAGLVGTHIHFLEPVGKNRTVWHIGYQDVIAVGKLFETGKLFTDRVVALGGPQVTKPRLLRTRLGIDLQALTAGQLTQWPARRGGSGDLGHVVEVDADVVELVAVEVELLVVHDDELALEPLAGVQLHPGILPWWGCEFLRPWLACRIGNGTHHYKKHRNE